MLQNEQKKQIIAMGLTCLRKKGEIRPIFSPTVPTKEELEQIEQGLKTGQIEENLLEKLFPMAYEGVCKYGTPDYYVTEHNRVIRKLARYVETDLVGWCTAYPATIIDKKDSSFLVQSCDNKRKLWTDSNCYEGIRTVDESKLEIGTYIILHRDKIHLILSQEEYEKAIKLFES